MAQQEKVFIDPAYQPDAGDGSKITLQFNPETAIARAQSKALYRQIASAVTMVALLALVVYGGISRIQEQRRIQVAAAINLEHAVRGVVTEVDVQKGSFTLMREFSVDPVVAATSATFWTVNLPPGERFDRRSGIGACFTVPSLKGPFGDPTPVSCADVVRIDAQLLVEYVMIDDTASTMVARTILSSQD